MSVPTLDTKTQAELAPPAVGAGDVTVIIPIYNETAHVEEILTAVRASPVAKEIVIVDEGSTDGTRDKLLALSPADGLTIVFHEKNHGKGAAVRTGLQYARGEYVLIQDSDQEYDPQDYPALLRPLREGKANVVYGVRLDRPERGLRFYLGAKLCCTARTFGTKPPATKYFVVHSWRTSRCSLRLETKKLDPFPVNFVRQPSR